MDVFKPVTIVAGSTVKDADCFTFAVLDQPEAANALIMDAEGTTLATAAVRGWNITPAGRDRILEESYKLVDFIGLRGGKVN